VGRASREGYLVSFVVVRLLWVGYRGAATLNLLGDAIDPSDQTRDSKAKKKWDKE
jgi:hypothetical protein